MFCYSAAMEIIYSKHNSERKTPKNLKGEDLRLFAHELSKEIENTTLLNLGNVYVLKDTIFSLRDFHFYLSETQTHKSNLPLKSLLKRILMLFNKGEKITKAVWIIDNWSEGYFHWLTDALPRLIASEKFSEDHIVILPMNYERHNYVREALSLLNYRVHYFNSNRHLLVKELILPSHTAPTGNYNKNIINNIRDRFLKSNKQLSHRNIFISRSKAHKRKIVNETEVISLLKLYDYEVHYFEDYSLRQQIEVMSQAKSLIGLHGAGLTNMLFMPKNGQVLEFRNRSDAHNNCYFSLASDLNHDYYYQLNDGNTNDTNIVDVTVNLEELRTNLDLMKEQRGN